MRSGSKSFPTAPGSSRSASWTDVPRRGARASACVQTLKGSALIRTAPQKKLCGELMLSVLLSTFVVDVAGKVDHRFYNVKGSVGHRRSSRVQGRRVFRRAGSKPRPALMRHMTLVVGVVPSSGLRSPTSAVVSRQGLSLNCVGGGAPDASSGGPSCRIERRSASAAASTGPSTLSHDAQLYKAAALAREG